MPLFTYTKTKTHKIYKFLGIKIRRRIKRYLTEEQQIWLNRMMQLQSLPTINRYEVESHVENLAQAGITDTPRSPRLIVSLTSYPKRMYDIHLCLYSLLTQDTKPDKLLLWLSIEEFPRGEEDVPKKVLGLKSFGLEIKWCNHNYKSFNKLIHALREYPDDIIVTADDDIFYTPDWLGKLYYAYQKHGKGVYAHRCHRIKVKGNEIMSYTEWEQCIATPSSQYQNFLTGVGGVLYSPRSLHPHVTNMELAQTLCAHADDVWFWGMCLLAGTKITLIDTPNNQLTYINPEREIGMNNDGTLFSFNGAGGDNDQQLRQLLQTYPAIYKTLMNELT